MDGQTFRQPIRCAATLPGAMEEAYPLRVSDHGGDTSSRPHESGYLPRPGHPKGLEATAHGQPDKGQSGPKRAVAANSGRHHWPVGSNDGPAGRETRPPPRPGNCLLTVFCLIAVGSARAHIPAFPGAEGFGAFARGGRGGDVYYVTNLNSSGPGSFADAVATAPAAGRTIVFGVSGYIPINKFNLNKSRITIAGQTAPGDGIGFKGGPLIINGSDIVIRHVRFRYGKQTAGGDCINLGNGVTNILLDHVSLMFSTDENLSSFSQNPRPDLVTFQWSLNAWGLETHSCGGLWDLNRVTTHHTLWAHNHTRNPKARPDGLLDWINNVTYDWTIGFILGDSTTPAQWKANVIGNYFICPPGNLRSVALEKARLDRHGNPNFTLYLANNLFDNNGNTLLDGTDRGYAIASGQYRIAPEPIVVPGPQVPVSADPPLTAYKKIVSAAGPLRQNALSGIPLRDEVDTILIENLVQWRRMRVSHENQTGASHNGWGSLNSAPAPLDSDLDGMPDYWEITLGWDPQQADHNVPLPTSSGTIAEPTFFPPGTPAGYTRLEEYLHFLALPHAVIPRSTPEQPSVLRVDLRRYTSGFSRPPVSFNLGRVRGGDVSLEADGFTAVFTPEPGFSGRAGFDFTVVDGDGCRWTQNMAILVSGVRVPRNLQWQGDGVSNRWDTHSPVFRYRSELVHFEPGDSVRLDDSGSNHPPLVLEGVLTPGLLEVTASQDYVLAGLGSLAGPMSLIKRGPGMLVLATTNRYSGGTVVTGGLLVLSNSTSAAGVGPVRMEGGELLLVAPGGPAVYNHALQIAGPAVIHVPGAGNANQAWGGPVTGTEVLSIHVAAGGMFSARSGMNLAGFSGTIQLSGPGTFRWQGGTGSTVTAFDLGEHGVMITRDGGTITLGSLAGGPTTLLAGAATTANPTTYIVGQRGYSVFEGTIRDGSAGSSATTTLVKLGSGELVLRGRALHSGGTRVGAGTLRINGHHGPAPLVVSNQATLAGTGWIDGPVTVLSGGRVDPGDDGPGTLTFRGPLTLSTPLLRFDLAGSPDGPSDRIRMDGGLLTLQGAQNFQFNLLEGRLRAGTYPLLEGAGQLAGSGFSFAHHLPTGSRQRFSVQVPPATSGTGYVHLVVEGDPATLVWRPRADNVWNTTSTNWLNQGQPDRFYPFDAVVVDDNSADVAEIRLGTTVNPSSLRVVIHTDRSITGPGTLTGSGTLFKEGPGTLSILNSNGTFQGAVHVAGGTVDLAAAGATLGHGPLILQGGGTFRLPPTSIKYTYAGVLTVPAGQTGTVHSPGLFNELLCPAISGDSNSVLCISGGVSFGGTDSGQLERFEGTIHVLPGATLRFSASASGLTFGSFRPTFRVDGSLRPRNAGNTIRLGAVTGSGSLEGPQSNAGSGDTVYVLGGNDIDTVFEGNISSNSAVAGSLVALRKVGSGILTLKGASTYTGGTLVEAGTLLVSNARGSGTGTGEVRVQSGATLGGTGFIAGAVTVEDHGRLAPGDVGPGTLTFHDDLDLGEFSELEFELGTISDRVVVGGLLTLRGRLHVLPAEGFRPGRYILFQYNSSQPVSDTGLFLVSAPAHCRYELDLSVAGEVALVVHPLQPPRFDLIQSGPGFVTVQGAGGVPGTSYVVLTATNLAVPSTEWTPLTTNHFDLSGGFFWSNAVPAHEPQRFYRLLVP